MKTFSWSNFSSIFFAGFELNYVVLHVSSQPRNRDNNNEREIKARSLRSVVFDKNLGVSSSSSYSRSRLFGFVPGNLARWLQGKHTEKERGEYIIAERRKKRGHPHRGELFFLDTQGLITRIQTIFLKN